MNIYYFGSVIKEDDFSEFKKHWKISLNPSNQNFHHKIIKSLSQTNKVDVFSIRPFSKKCCDLPFLEENIINDNNITWNYLKMQNKLDGFKVNKKVEDGIVLIDTMNLKAIISGNRFAKLNHLPTIGICTDSPYNITGSKRYKAKATLFLSKFNGYICLTNKLNNLFNKKQKPYLIINGVEEYNDGAASKNEYGKYIFYGGSLMEKYGVGNLIEAFKEIKEKDIKLLLCGHHEESWLKETIEKDDRICYLGNLDIQEVKQLEKNALMCVNPRPLDNTIDEYSYPSKVLEYFASGSIVVSTKHPLVYKTFKQEGIWLEDNNAKSIIGTINSVISGEIKNNNNSKEIIKKEFGLISTNKKLSQFLAKINF